MVAASNLNSEDYYEILGVPKTASDAALKKAYKKLAVKWHPDKNPGDEQATKNFQKISEAYATLSDDKKRKLYDAYGKQAADQSEQMPGGGMPGGGASFSFGGMPGGGGRSMSPEEAQVLFSQFFGGSDPFGGGGGGMMGGMMGRGPRGGGIFMSSSSMNSGQPMSFMNMMGGQQQQQPTGGGFGTTNKKRQRETKRYDAIPVGTVVSLKGLVSRPERNGDRGQILQYDPSSGRYVVQIEDIQETIKVKPSNLLQHVPVTVHGLMNNAELNGEKGTVLTYDDQKERYTVYVTNKSKAISVRPSNLILDNGTVGQISGLVSKPELNGRWGTVSKFDKGSGRYDVQLSIDKIVRLKLDNIRL